MVKSTEKSPRKLDPNVALVPIPASVAPFSFAAAIVFVQEAISFICERL